MSELEFTGRMTIRVHFNNRLEYEKFRKYILKTEWSYCLDYPPFEEIVVTFSNTEDFTNINKKLIYLLQLGFDVYCCRYQLEQSLAEHEHPEEEDQEPATYIDGVDFSRIDLGKEIADLWKACGRN